ncbi:membrane protein insertion efficiency factor YidD [Cupriavidus respiraculi]|uniref:membrane protein insertion efficiency factor YidD n=1 Tax=Cupriavidus respiraculi TaxID=195930 RepID=UPI001C984041|nr:membrane protein insertion efficiency factor YidD [Cupriavidus respiraculi]MBY4946433.1 membrane protein insertion efficiency factor YidD [Cupriavidus respiraculi]
MKRILLALLRIYKIALSPYVGSQCRFLPTCSDYAREAIDCHGAGRGSWLAARRLCRCHPFANGGYDPVPPASSVPSDQADAAPAGARATIRLPRP